MCELFISYSCELNIFNIPFAFLIPLYSFFLAGGRLISFEFDTKTSPFRILQVLAAPLNKELFKLQITFATIFIMRNLISL